MTNKIRGLRVLAGGFSCFFVELTRRVAIHTIAKLFAHVLPAIALVCIEMLPAMLLQMYDVLSNCCRTTMVFVSHM